MQIRHYSYFFWVVAIVMAIEPVSAFGIEQGGWPVLKIGGAIVLIRHALAPGSGDPANFSLDDCTTQRNLSDAGRRQALALGDAFRRRQIPVKRVYSSQWCRCKETAQLAFGTFEELSSLNSFFEYPQRQAHQIDAIKGFLQQRRPHSGNLILVTHQVNITALTNVFPSQGEIIVTRMKQNKQLEVITRIGLLE